MTFKTAVAATDADARVVQLPLNRVLAEADYRRPPLAWIKRRTRRIERFFQVPRRVALYEATTDYYQFTRMHRERVLRLIHGGAA
ncbi:MAG: hypothetical protein LT082_08815 [Comamonas sp.]|nr:hypothetical protein [Comamonas sp.]